MYRESQLKALLEHRRILIAGYGREGQSSHRLLQRLLPDAEPDVAHNDDEIYTLLSQHRYDMILKSPGISTMKFEGRCDLNTLTSQTDLFLQVYGDHTAAVTGTKGKSTTTTLLWHLLKEAFPQRHMVLAGNMGIPLFDVLEELDEQCQVVAEFSCHQLENIHRGPHVGILLNLYQEHLDHYHDYKGYQMAKMQLALRQQAGDYCFYCTDSPVLVERVEELRSQMASTLHPYSLREAAASPMAQWSTSLQGDHNLCNIYVACAAARLLGADDAALRQAVASFHGLPHRMEAVGTYGGVTFYNDSISTIPEAAIAAVEALQQVDTLILGGFDRGIDYRVLGDYLRDSDRGRRVRNLVFVGEAGRRMMEEWLLADRYTLLTCDYETAVAWCYEHTAQGRICLLSPAAASYDAFKNFEERGSRFKQLVESFNPTRRQ